MRGGIDRGDHRFLARVVGFYKNEKRSRICKRMEEFLIRRWDPILPGCGGTSTLSRRATLAARWLHEPQPMATLLSSSVYRNCRDMEGFLIRGCDLILAGCGETLALAREETFAARWLHEPHPISNQPVRLGFSHRVGRYRPGGSPFSSPGRRRCRRMEGFLIRRWDPILPRCGGTSTLARGAILAAR